MNYIIQIFSAFMATYFAGILFRSNRSHLFLAGLLGALGWAAYLLGISFGWSTFLATFLASFVVSICSVILARIRKTPVTAFQVIAIFPIVPGAGMYHILYASVTSQYSEAITYFFSTMQTAAAIALGILIANSFNPYALRLENFSHRKA